MPAVAVIVFAALVCFIVVLFTGKKENRSSSDTPKALPRTVRCPHCGSPAAVRGKTWECGWCGDFGQLK